MSNKWLIIKYVTFQFYSSVLPEYSKSFCFLLLVSFPSFLVFRALISNNFGCLNLLSFFLIDQLLLTEGLIWLRLLFPCRLLLFFFEIRLIFEFALRDCLFVILNFFQDGFLLKRSLEVFIEPFLREGSLNCHIKSDHFFSNLKLPLSKRRYSFSHYLH